MPQPYTVLTKRKDFVRIQHSQTKVVTKGIIICALPRDAEQPSNQIGFTVTKTVGNAVIRNRVKRRLRALVHEILPAFQAFEGDLVLIGRKATISRDYEGLKKDFKYALHRLLKDPAKNS